MRIRTGDFSAAVAVDTQDISGIIGGATVLTMDGELPVEHLNAGDRIITRDAGMSVLREVRVHQVETAVIRIKAGSLGHTRPDRDTVTAPGAMILVRDWRAEALFGAKSALVPASRLLDGEFVSEEEVRKVAVFELVFDSQHIVYVDGIEMATAA